MGSKELSRIWEVLHNYREDCIPEGIDHLDEESNKHFKALIEKLVYKTPPNKAWCGKTMNQYHCSFRFQLICRKKPFVIYISP